MTYRDPRRPLLAMLALLAACAGDGTGLDVEPLVILTEALPSAGLSLEYDRDLEALGGNGSYTWSVTSGTLPEGLDLNPTTGRISGVATVLGTETFSVEVRSGSENTAERELSLTVSDFIGVIEWPFSAPLDRASVPTQAVVEAFYNGFYNDPPCDNAGTTLASVPIPWNTSSATHRYDAEGDPAFLGFTECLTDGQPQHLALGVRDVSGWGVLESVALGTAAPDLSGETIDFIELVVDEMSRSGTEPSVEVVIVMRWLIFGT